MLKDEHSPQACKIFNGYMYYLTTNKTFAHRAPCMLKKIKFDDKISILRPLINVSKKDLIYISNIHHSCIDSKCTSLINYLIIHSQITALTLIMDSSNSTKSTIAFTTPLLLILANVVSG